MSLSSLKSLRGLPRFSSLTSSLESLMEGKAGHIRCIALFGSMVKGTYGAFSDYDLFIVTDDGEKGGFMERLEEYSRLVSGGVELFVYTESEVKEMMGQYHPLLLDALKDGVAILDSGLWADLRGRLQRLVSQGVLKQVPMGWDIRV